MNASKARDIMETAKAIDDVKRFFPIIEKAAQAKAEFIQVRKKDITLQEVKVLIKTYGYQVTEIENEDAEYDRSATIWGYKISW